MAHVVNPTTDVGYHHDPHYDDYEHHVDRYRPVHHEPTPVEYFEERTNFPSLEDLPESLTKYKDILKAYIAPSVVKHEHLDDSEDYDFDYAHYKQEKFEQKERKHQMKEKERLEKEQQKQKEHEAKMQMK